MSRCVVVVVVVFEFVQVGAFVFGCVRDMLRVCVFSKLQYCDDGLAFLFAQVVICLSRCMCFVFRNCNIIMVSCVVCSHMVGFAFDRA